MATQRGAHVAVRDRVRVGISSAVALCTFVACTEEWTNHDLHVLNPVVEKDETTPAPAADAAADPTTTSTAVAVDAAPVDAAPVEAFVSDLAYVVVANGFGPPEKDKSNGEDAANDGKAITLAGVTYAKGLGVHAASEIDVPLGGQYKTFLADVGVDDEVMTGGSIVFRVLADGEQLFDSGPMTGATAVKKVSVAVAGKQTLKLVVTDNGNGIGQDHGDWANARLQK
jgi:hypothetical protein